MSTARLEAFSDGVFAIAITLLILEVHVPEGSGSLLDRLGRTWPDFVAYVIAFVTIGIMWANHHSIFHLIGRTTHGLVVANLLLLLSVSFLPFPTKILGEELGHGGADQRTAAILFSACFVVIALFFNLVWQIAARRNRLIRAGCEDAAAEVTRRYRLGIPSYLAATLMAVWNVPLSLVIEGGLALLYILPGQSLLDVDEADVEGEDL